MNKIRLFLFLVLALFLCQQPVFADKKTSLFGTQSINFNDGDENVIGSGDYKFKLNVSQNGNIAIDTNFLSNSISAALGVNAISEIKNATIINLFAQNKAPQKGDVIILKNDQGYYAALKIVSIKIHPVDASKNQLTFDYYILTDQGADFSHIDTNSNKVPVAAFVATPTSGNAPLTVNLDASASHMQDAPLEKSSKNDGATAKVQNTIVSYDWDSSDGEKATGKLAFFTYTTPGSYKITLTVTDANGATASKQKTITVLSAPTTSNKAPLASFTATPTSGNSPLTVNVDASASKDSDGTISSYSWAISNGQVANGKTANFIFNEANTYTVTLTVKDNKGATASASKSIVVNATSSSDLGYNQTARLLPQVIMAGMTPSVIDMGDTEFEIIALVRPGVLPLQSVTIGQGNNPLFNKALTHINTLPNGDQFWKTTFAFERGAFGAADFPVKWGSTPGAFYIRATDINQQSFEGNNFPAIRFANAPAQTMSKDDTKDDKLIYNGTKRFAPQIIMGGVSPAIVDILDTEFDIVTLVRPGFLPIQNVVLKQGDNPLFSIAMEKKSELSNGDQIWISTFKFPQGQFGTKTLPIVWGGDAGEFHIEVIDTAQQVSAGYPLLRSGNYPKI